MSALAERDELEAKRNAARSADVTRQGAQAAQKARGGGATTPTATGAQLGPQGQVPGGLSNEGAANLATQVTTPTEVKALAQGGASTPGAQVDPKTNAGPGATTPTPGVGPEGKTTDSTQAAADPKQGAADPKQGAHGPKHGPGGTHAGKHGAHGAKDPHAGPGHAGPQQGQEGRATTPTTATPPGAAPAAGAGGGGAFEIDFIAREYAIHEKWASLPPGRDDVTREYTAAEVKDAGGQGPTLSIEQRRELLNKALGGGVASGAAQFGLGMAIKLGVNQGSKLLVTKGLGKAVPFVGLVFSAWDLGTYLSQGKYESMTGLGKIGSVLTGKASRKDWIQFLKGVKSLTDLLGAVLGVAAAVCGIIAALTSWTVLGGVSFGALAAGLGIASGILSLVGTLLSGAIAYLEYQEVLEMEGSPDEILKMIGDFEGDVASTTEGALSAPGKVKDLRGKVKSIQKKTVTESTPPVREEPKTTPPQVEPQAAGPVARPESRIVLPGQGGDVAGGLVKPQAPAGFEQSAGGLYVPKGPGGGGLVKPGGLVVPGAPPGYERSAGGLYVPAGTQAGPATPATSVTPAAPATTTEGPAAPPGTYRVTGNLDPANAGHGRRGLGSEIVAGLRGSGRYAPEKPAKASDFEGFEKAYVSGKAPNVKRTVQQLDNWFGDGRGTNLGPVVLSDKVPVEAFAQGELATTRSDVTFLPSASGGTLIRRASLASLPNPPFSLARTVARLERTAHLAYQEEGLTAALGVGHEGQQKLSAELGPGGTAAELSKLYQQYDQSIAKQAAEVQQKDAKVTTSEELLARERAKDQQTRGKTDEVMNNEAARKIGDVTSDPFLSTAVRGGAGVAKAVGGAVNWVASNVFGAKEDVVDTRAIDNVRKLFSEAPKARDGRGKMAGSSGQVGTSAEKTAGGVAANRAKVTQTKGRHTGAKGKVVQFKGAGKRTTDTLQAEKEAQARENAELEAQREKVRAEREREFSAYTSEMGALSLWAVQHRSVRDANNALLDDLASPPQVAELTPDARQRLEGARTSLGGARAAIERAREQMSEAARATSEGLRKAAVQAGATPDSVQPICAKLDSEVERFHGRRLQPQLATLASLEGMLGSVGPDRLPGVVDAAQRTARAAEVSARDAVAAFQRFARKTGEATMSALQAEMEQARHRARTAANL